MSKLKELTWENHKKAERMTHARKLLKGMEPGEYYRFIYNQYVQYKALEDTARNKGLLKGIEGICRQSAMDEDLKELETQHGYTRDETLLCPVVDDYIEHVAMLDEAGLLSHIYVRHFGELHGGQMIKKRAPGSGKMYDFDNAKQLIADVRAQLNDDMAPEANRCFEFAMKLFEELDR
tara:strand:+ start:908 stop:1441 length:534 start_codon:yes stop_codon:yes gene_type:complete